MLHAVITLAAVAYSPARLDYAALHDTTSASHRSLLGDTNDATAQLRTDMEQLVNARFGQLEGTLGAAQGSMA